MGYLLLIAIVLVIVGYFLFRVISDGPRNGDDQMISFVALLREPQRIEPIYVATAAKKAWGADLSYDESDEEGPDGFVVGDDSTPTLIVKYRERMIMVNNLAAPYVDDPQEVADTIPDLRLRGLVAEHTAWLSCDALGVESFDDDVVREWYRILGPLFSELVDDNCLAILTPLTGHLAPNMDETLEMLKSDDPLQALEDDAPVPVIQVSDDDPRMIAAVEEAQRRWPEFVAAFEQRNGENFSVKAPVTAGDNTEFIWLNVTAIENQVIYGQLANEPVSLGNLKIGSKVRVMVEKLNDWVVVQNGQPVGLFTAKVITDAANEQNDKS